MNELSKVIEKMSNILNEKNYNLRIKESKNGDLNDIILKFNQILHELKTQHNDYKLLIDRENDAVVKFLKDGTITYINKGFENIFQYSANEIIGKSFLKILSGRDESFIKSLGKIDNLAELLPVHNELPFQMEAYSKSGKSFPIEMTLSHLELNEFNSYVGLIRSKELDPVNEKLKERNFRKLLELSHIGFCFIDQDCFISEEYSKVLESFFSDRRLNDKSFLEVLSKVLADKKVKELTVFINLLFSEKLSSSNIDQMNPIRNVEVTCYDKNNETYNKQMEFRFKQIEKLGTIDSLFITVIDITENIEHLKKLHKSNDQLDKQINSLINIMHLDPAQLQVFLNDVSLELNNISQILKRDDRVMPPEEKIEHVIPTLNYIYCYSKALKIQELEIEISKLNAEISKLQLKTILSGSDFFSFVVMHKRFTQLVDKLSYLNNKFLDFKDNYLKENNSEDIIFKEYTENVLEGFEKNYEKKSNLIWSVFEFNRLPPKYTALIKSICQILVAFSLKENIENSDVRKRRNKPELAQIKISFRHVQRNEFSFTYQDDGESISDEDAEDILLKQAKRGQRFYKEFNLISKKLKGLRSRIYLDCKREEFFVFTLSFTVN